MQFDYGYEGIQAPMYCDFGEINNNCDDNVDEYFTTMEESSPRFAAPPVLYTATPESSAQSSPCPWTDLATPKHTPTQTQTPSTYSTMLPRISPILPQSPATVTFHHNPFTPELNRPQKASPLRQQNIAPRKAAAAAPRRWNAVASSFVERFRNEGVSGVIYQPPAQARTPVRGTTPTNVLRTSTPNVRHSPPSQQKPAKAHKHRHHHHKHVPGLPPLSSRVEDSPAANRRAPPMLPSTPPARVVRELMYESPKAPPLPPQTRIRWVARDFDHDAENTRKPKPPSPQMLGRSTFKLGAAPHKSGVRPFELTLVSGHAQRKVVQHSSAKHSKRRAKAIDHCVLVVNDREEAGLSRHQDRKKHRAKGHGRAFIFQR